MNKFSKVTPIILSIVGSAGVAGTALLAIKDTKKVVPEGTKTFKRYLPTILVGGASIASIAVGTIISKKTEAALGATVVALEQTYNRYQGKVKQMLGVENHQEFMKQIADEDIAKAESADGKKLYWNEYIGRFKAKPELVMEALSNMNMRLNTNPEDEMREKNEYGWCSFEQFILDCDGEILDQDKYEMYKDYGWALSYLEDKGADSYWIYSNRMAGQNDLQGYTIIEFRGIPLPIAYPEHYSEDYYWLAKKSYSREKEQEEFYRRDNGLEEE